MCQVLRFREERLGADLGIRTFVPHDGQCVLALCWTLLAGLKVDINTTAASEVEELIELPLRKSAFRAILARVAVLCNERCPNSVSPYGGQGELLVDTDPATALRVAFVNTPDEQSLELASLRNEGMHALPEAAQTPICSKKSPYHPGQSSPRRPST